MVQRMAKHVGASQAIITRTAEIISQAGQSEDAEYKGELALAPEPKVQGLGLCRG